MFYSDPSAKYFAQNSKMLLINADRSVVSLFGCSPVIVIVNKRKVKFLTEYVRPKSCNSLRMLFACMTQNEPDALL